MDKALYIAMTGAKHNMKAQAAHANNLANVNTSGFKADFIQARSMGVYYGDGLPTRAYALTENPATNFSNGSLVQTGRDLDVAIQGDGFIAVQGDDGTQAYTRTSSFIVDSLGVLRTSNGLAVMGENGPVAIPQNEKIDIADDGTINIVPEGDTPENIVVLDRIMLVNPDIADLEKSQDGLFRAKDPQQDFVADANVRLASGYVEGSNVNAVSEMTQIMSLARQYEMQVKLMQTVEKNSEATDKLLQQS